MAKKINLVVVGPSGRRVGLVVSSFKKLIEKCVEKFEYDEEDLRVTLDDETEVDEEYFEFISAGTELYITTTRVKKAPTEIRDLASFLHKCLANQPKIYDKIVNVLRDSSNTSQASGLLNLLAQVSHTSAAASERACDEEWFKGLDTKFKTKESVMRNSAETRMRSYLEQAKRELLVVDISDDTPARQALNFFREQLKISRYNAAYFDRTASKRLRLCDSSGLFECEGQYNCSNCSHAHFINPYSCREARIVFSTWNLDHVIEKTRSILPVLKRALDGPRSQSVNLSYFHSLLFEHKDQASGNTEGNLKLVHIACHVKKPHENKCNEKKVYIKKSVSATNGHDTVDAPALLTCSQSPKRSCHNTRRRRRQNKEDYKVRRSKRKCVTRNEDMKRTKLTNVL